jgi:hypothetical protein
MSSDLIKHVTDASFEADVLKAEGPYWSTTGLNGVALAK